MSSRRALEPLRFRTPTRSVTYRPAADGDPDGVEVVDGVEEASTVVALADSVWDELRSVRHLPRR